MGNNFAMLDIALGNDKIACSRWDGYLNRILPLCWKNVPEQIAGLNFARS